MANILNIDTSSSICSVSLSINGEICVGYESMKKMDHSTTLAPFVDKCLDFLREKDIKLDAVAVTLGPGSYTGLRIGLSMAKGLSFGFDIPLIALSSLEVMAVRAIFTYAEFTGEEYVIPMIDAKRMEVYTAVFSSDLSKVKDEEAKILDEDSFAGMGDKKIVMIGDGIEKFKEISHLENAVFLGDGMAHAKYMPALSEKKFRNKEFADVAYTVPSYLKEYRATKPKIKI
ncbi:MAG: tRNA (adenosine(37)-N6)-threonylcarbamoyltransferase complex dimerization subunit type 1 TsaB [Muribaculaceae bacterium]|nr:tRNA (adenosine(37)-N6)-threonylcarbamoyltransferase complex dimerization subunit type 1 TsaB [Muribaculaceae bacterium]